MTKFAPIVRRMQLASLLLLASVIAVQVSRGEDVASSKIELDSISEDVMKGGSTQNRHTIVTWCAPQYLQAMGRAAGDTDEEIEEILEVLRPYNMFIVLSKTIQLPYSQKIETPEEILSRIQFVDRDGIVYKPLTSDEVSEDAKTVSATLASGFGRQAGLKMTVVLFPAKDRFGKAVADATKKGSFKITMDKLSIAWELPLDSVAKGGR